MWVPAAMRSSCCVASWPASPFPAGWSARQPQLDRFFRRRFGEMVREFDGDQFGRELLLSASLSAMLTRLMRWPGGRGNGMSAVATTADWDMAARALRFLQQNHTKPIYGNDLACEIGISETGLKRLFRDTLGMPWGRYLQSYRVHRAAALLTASDAKITHVALAVGFESLSHFNATFRAMMDMSPKTYMKHATTASATQPKNGNEGNRLETKK